MDIKHESLLLRPRDPSLLNSDYWPEFELKNVHVFAPDDPSASPANLLHAGQWKPLTLTGKLGPPTRSNASSWLTNPATRNVSIQVTGVREFSYGQYGDGTVDIWAAGQAGWFTIRPSRVYKETYNDIVQAVKLLYYMADTYKAVKKYSDLTTADFFQKFCDEQPDMGSFAKSVEALIEKHRYFLIASMLTGKEGVQWIRVPLFSHIEEAYPDDVQIVRQRIGLKQSKAPSRKGSTQSPAPSNSSIKRKRGPPKDRSATPLSTIPRRATRSTRSNSAATLNSIVVHEAPYVEPIQEVMSTPKHAEKAVMQEIQTSSEEENEISGREHTGAKGRSVLRPRPSKYIPIPRDDHEVTPGVRGEKLAVLPVKDSNEASSNSSAREEDESVRPGTESSDVEMDEAEDPTSLPFRLQNAERNGDMWRCPVDGCMHRVYAASEPSSQLLVKAHQSTHESDDDERIQLVRRMEAPWLPVNRLMDRVRGMAQKDFPPPIVQRY